jgi:hypothetical protein
VLATLALATLSAQAGTVTNGAWSPTGCGAKPEVAALNLKDEDAYNKSIDGVTAYRKAIQAYVTCQAQEANADIAAISKSANAVQTAAKEANEKIQADVKAAEQKFK